MIRAFILVAGRDLRLAFAGGGDAAIAVAFFLVVATIFPFGIGSEQALLARIGAGIVWVAALLAALLSLERVFATDFEDGALDLLALGPLPLPLLALAKALAHWLASGLPLVAAAPLVALLYGLPVDALPVLALALLLGTPTLSLLGAVGAALTLGARRGGVLVPLLVLPLAVPVLIFGAAAAEAAIIGGALRLPLSLLAAFLLAAVALAPWAAGAALRQAVGE
ncbi:MAG: heme exporter protein CcmB [Alphaproteobacteria bacterium]